MPVAAVVARKARLSQLLRLWVGAGVMNLFGAWVFAWLIVLALPRVHPTAIERAAFFDRMRPPEAIALGIIAGIAAITNAVGGLLLVTTLRLAQVGVKELRTERERSDGEDREDEGA